MYCSIHFGLLNSVWIAQSSSKVSVTSFICMAHRMRAINHSIGDVLFKHFFHTMWRATYHPFLHWRWQATFFSFQTVAYCSVPCWWASTRTCGTCLTPPPSHCPILKRPAIGWRELQRRRGFSFGRKCFLNHANFSFRRLQVVFMLIFYFLFDQFHYLRVFQLNCFIVYKF